MDSVVGALDATASRMKRSECMEDLVIAEPASAEELLREGMLQTARVELSVRAVHGVDPGTSLMRKALGVVTFEGRANCRCELVRRHEATLGSREHARPYCGLSPRRSSLVVS